MLFNFIEQKDFKGLQKYITENDNIDLDSMDIHSNYFIQYLVNYNMIHIIKWILINKTIRLDVLDTDGRNLLYSIIKYNYKILLLLLLEYDKNSIGINIINMRDNFGNTGLNYCIIFNNFEIFKILYQYGADVYNVNNDLNNIYEICLHYKRNTILQYLLTHQINTVNITNLSLFLNKNGFSVLQSIILYENFDMLEFIIGFPKFIKMIVNNIEYEYGLTALQQCMILSYNNIVFKLLEHGGDINISDYTGNTCIHYAFIEKNYNIILEFIKKKINFSNTLNISNMNGDTPLHIYLENITGDNITGDNITGEDITGEDNMLILEELLLHTNINIMNNNKNTILYLLVIKKLYKNDKIKQILTNGITIMNLFITNKENMNILELIVNKNDYNEFLQIAITSYYNILQNNKNKEYLVIDIEKKCADGNNKKDYCINYIKKMIINKKRSFPEFIDIKIDVIKDVFKDNYYYTGSTIDILFGLIYLYTHYDNINLILEYPLIHNNILDAYYKKLGLNYSFKLDFSNIELVWTYMKLISLTHFDDIIKMKIQNNNNKQFIIIPLGIEVATGSHANIIIIDIINQTIERFEPNGRNCPVGFYYHPKLLDDILYDKFIILLPNFTYLKPCDFLPAIGFQIYEISDSEKYKKLGDPNGFCAVWCVWWAEQRIKNPSVKPNILFNKLLEKILLSQESFKNLIRNYSIHISSLRDSYLERYKLTIDDWMTNNYTSEDLNKIEGDIIKIL